MPAPSAPGKPTGVAGNNQVTLSWNAPVSDGGSAIIDYRIQRKINGQPDSSFVNVTDSVSSSTSVVVTGLTNGTAYIFRVRAVNALNLLGPFSLNSSPITPVTTPGAPTITSVVTGNSTATLTWTAPTIGAPITDYVIQRKFNGTNDDKYVTISDGVSTATTYTNSGLTNGISYIFRVAAVNSVGQGPYSTPSAPALVAGVPSQPNEPTGVPGNAVVNLSWIAPNNNGSPITDYVIQRKVNGALDTTYVTLSDGVSTLTSYTSINLVNGTSYVFRVAAKNIKGTGPFSLPSSPLKPVKVPDAPTNLIATPSGSSTALTWRAPANGGSVITDYVIIGKLTSQSDAEYAVVSDSITAATSAVVTKTPPGPFTFKVAAVNAVGQGNFSGPSNSVISVPAAPTNLVANPTGNGQITLNWTAPANGGSSITDYVVQYKLENTNWTTYTDGVNSTTTAVVNNLAYLDYTFRVAAKNSVGIGPYSSDSNLTKPYRLFDKSSWSGVVGAPWLNYLNQSADRWSRFIQSDPNEDDSWTGIKLQEGEFNLYNDSSDDVIASCGVYYYKNLGNGKYNTISFILNINTYYQNIFSANDWVNILTHELGHALGIGQYWQDFFEEATPPVNYFLDGSVYTETQSAYNSIVNLSRVKIPLESTGSAGTQSAHWEDNFRLDGNISYRGVINELMVGTIDVGDARILSQLSIQNLVDFGYFEVNPGTSEGTPTVAPSLVTSMIPENRIKLNCCFNREKMREYKPSKTKEFSVLGFFKKKLFG